MRIWQVLLYGVTMTGLTIAAIAYAIVWVAHNV